MKMYNAIDHRDAELHHLVVSEWGAVEVVVQRSKRVVVRDQPQLCARVSRRHVRANVPQDILMTQQDGTVKVIKIIVKPIIVELL